MSNIRGYYFALFESEGLEPFSIHGLWPQYDRNHWPQFCTHNTFDFNRLEPDIIERLHQHWHSSRGKDRNFWKHEWQRHGTCTGMTENEYFQKALWCFDQIKQKKVKWILKHEIGDMHVIPISLDWKIGKDDWLNNI